MCVRTGLASLILALLPGGFGLAWLAAQTRQPSQAAEKDSAAASQPAAWAVKRLAVQWEKTTADEALADLATRLGQPIWVSDGARRRAEGSHVYLVARHLTGAQALDALCRLSGLCWTFTEGVVAITQDDQTPTTWRMRARAERARILRNRLGTIRAHVGTPTADLDMVDVTVSAAVARLGEAYQLNLWVPERMRKSQDLITLQGQRLGHAEALDRLAKQFAVRVVESDGVFWLLPGDMVASFAGARSRPVASRPATSRPQGSLKRRWVQHRAGTVTAAGWADEIRAVRQWRARHPNPGGRTSVSRGRPESR